MNICTFQIINITLDANCSKHFKYYSFSKNFLYYNMLTQKETAYNSGQINELHLMSIYSRM